MHPMTMTRIQILGTIILAAVLSDSICEANSTPALRKRSVPEEENGSIQSLYRNLQARLHPSGDLNKRYLEQADIEAEQFWNDYNVVTENSMPPSAAPSNVVTQPPTTEAPIPAPTSLPTASPVAPTDAPVVPTTVPVSPPTSAPTEGTVAPTMVPLAPTASPITSTEAPTVLTGAPVAPTTVPTVLTIAPTLSGPTSIPDTTAPTSVSVSLAPSSTGSSMAPGTVLPTGVPAPTTSPTGSPPDSTDAPTSSPVLAPTVAPTTSPVATTAAPTGTTAAPTTQAVGAPTAAPTTSPVATTAAPTGATAAPTTPTVVVPTAAPTVVASEAPTGTPIVTTAAPTASATPGGTSFSTILTLQQNVGICGNPDTNGVGCAETDEASGNGGNPNDLVNCFNITDTPGGTSPFVLSTVRFWLGTSIDPPTDLSLRVYSALNGAPTTQLLSQPIEGYLAGENTFPLTSNLTITTDEFCVGLNSQNPAEGLRVQNEVGLGDQSYVLAPQCGVNEFTSLMTSNLMVRFCIEAFVFGL